MPEEDILLSGGRCAHQIDEGGRNKNNFVAVEVKNRSSRQYMKTSLENTISSKLNRTAGKGSEGLLFFFFGTCKVTCVFFSSYWRVIVFLLWTLLIGMINSREFYCLIVFTIQILCIQFYCIRLRLFNYTGYRTDCF